MTETQAKSEVEEISPDAAAADAKEPVDSAKAADKPAESRDEDQSPSGAKVAVGRATVPGDRSAPTFTRAPGMAPPPDRPPADHDGRAPGTADGASTKTDQAEPGSRTVALGRVATGRISVAGLNTAALTSKVARAVGLGGAVGSAKVGAPAGRPGRATGNPPARGPRRARLFVKRIDPWSVMKFSFAVAIVLFVVGIVATSVLYLALDAMGVFDSINKALGDMVTPTGATSGTTFKITAKGVIFTAALLGLVNVVLFTALATLGAFIYNVCSDLVGGIEVTLSERD
ncbi:MAG TPA: DUF3566 domain-containing protein [Micromonosporaceae bacterium]